MSKIVACVGDRIYHGGSNRGSITETYQDGTTKLDGVLIAILGDKIHCSTHGSGTIVNTPNTKTTINGVLVVTYGAKTNCGAEVRPPDRKMKVG